MPAWAFAAMVAGGLWLCLWTTRAAAARPGPGRHRRRRRCAGASRPTCWSPATAGTLRWSTQTARPSSCATAPAIIFAACSPRHRVRRRPDGNRRPGGQRCSRDACIADVRRAASAMAAAGDALGYASTGRHHQPARRISSFPTAAAASCTPRWLKLDRSAGATGGWRLPGRTAGDSVASVGAHPWAADA